MSDYIHSVVKPYEPQDTQSNLTSLLSPSRISVIGFNPTLRCALLCSKYYYHILNLTNKICENSTEFVENDVVRRERTTNLEHKFDPSVVKFSQEGRSGGNLFATLCKTETIEINKLINNEDGGYSVKRVLAENDRQISHSRYVNDISWSNKGHKLASVCKDSNLKVWQVTEDGRIKLVNKFNTVSQASFVRWDLKDHNRIATTIDRQLKFWDLRQLRQACEWFYMDDSRTNNHTKSVDFSEHHVLSLMAISGTANQAVVRVHDRRRHQEGDSNKRTKKMKLFEEKIIGAREARFSSDGKQVLVLVDEGKTDSFMASPTHSQKSNSIKIFNIDGNYSNTGPKVPVATITTPTTIMQWQHLLSSSADGPSIAGFTKEIDGIDRVHQIHYHHWRYSISDDEDEDMFKDIHAPTDLVSEAPTESEIRDANNIKTLTKRLEDEATMIRKSHYDNRIHIQQETREGSVIVTFTTGNEVKVVLQCHEGYPSNLPTLSAVSIARASTEERDTFQREFDLLIRQRHDKSRFVLEPIYRKIEEICRTLRTNSESESTSSRSDTLPIPATIRPTFSKHEMRNAAFPARCGSSWCSDKLVVWANKKIPGTQDLLTVQRSQEKRTALTVLSYKIFADLASFARAPEASDHSPKSRQPYLRTLGAALTRQGSIDGRTVHNLQKFPPVKVELHSIAPLTNLCRELAEKYLIPTTSENLAVMGPSKYRLDDVFRIQIADRNLQLATEHARKMTDESFSYSVVVWSTLKTMLEYWKNVLRNSQLHNFNFQHQWLPNAKRLVENLIKAGDRKVETQTLALLATFLFSIPYFETGNDFNQKSIVSLLKLSPATCHILHIHVQQYCKILDSWMLHFDRTKLVKAMYAEDVIRNFVMSKSRISPVSKETKAAKADSDRSLRKLTKLLGYQPTMEQSQPNSPTECQCQRCENCHLYINVKCSICRQDITGLSWCCISCLHYSHIACQEVWFERREKCPRDSCDCHCKSITSSDL